MLQSSIMIWPYYSFFLGPDIIYMRLTHIFASLIAKSVLGLAAWRMYIGPVHAIQ